MQRKHLLLSVFLLLSCLTLAAGAVLAQAGSGTITGTVTDAISGAPVRGASVVLSPSGKRVRSDASGRYMIRGVSAGTYTITCRASGYQAQSARSLRMVQAGALAHDCRLTPSSRSSRVKDTRGLASAAAESDVSELAAPVTAAGGTGSRRSMIRRAPARSMAMTQRPYQPAQPVMVQPEHNTEGYEARDENPFVSPRTSPLSTFSIDVDTASYSNVRRFIESMARLPPRDAVKIEELVNYFSYDYPEPRGAHPFSVNTEISTAPWHAGHRLVRIGLQSQKIRKDRLPPSNLVFLIDVSGSMNPPNRLPLLKSAFSLLVNELRPQDRVAMVVYAGAAGVVLPSTSGADKDTILHALDRLQAGGSTAGSAGIALAYQVARQNFIKGGNNRVILATDGDFNVGPSSDAELVRIIERQRKSGVFLTVLGFGMRNYQDAKMEKLAASGNGNHAYIDTLSEARKVLVSEMGATLFTVAKDVKLQVEFNPAKVKGYRLIGYENRMLAARDFNDDKKDAGDMGAGHSVTAFYEIIPAGSSEAVAGVDELKYQAVYATSAAASDELMTVKLRYKAPDSDSSKLMVYPIADRSVPLARTSTDFRFATAVVEFGLLLRGSEHRGKASYRAALARAQGALGKDREGYRKAFVDMVRKAESLAGTR